MVEMTSVDRGKELVEDTTWEPKPAGRKDSSASRCLKYPTENFSSTKSSVSIQRRGRPKLLALGISWPG